MSFLRNLDAPSDHVFRHCPRRPVPSPAPTPRRPHLVAVGDLARPTSRMPLAS